MKYPPGNVILLLARCWRSSLSSELNRKTLKARCSRPWGCRGRNLQAAEGG